jgi:hypothetical protein
LCLEQNSEFPILVIAVLAALRRKEVGDPYVVVDNLAFDEHAFVLGFFLVHGRKDWLLAY